MKPVRYLRPWRTCLLLLALLAACDGGTEPLRPAAMTAVDGADQSAEVASLLPIAPAVKVATADGRGVPGIDVTFVVSGGGTITGAAQKTDASGVARIGAWTLGSTAGDQTVTATATALPGIQTVITARARAAAPAVLAVAVQPSAAASSGFPLSVQPVVVLQDRFGNRAPVAGVAVTAAPAGGNVTVTHGSATTDADGTATFSSLTLNGTVGSYSLVFRAAGLSEAFAPSVRLDAGTPHRLGMLIQPGTSSFQRQRLNPAPMVEVLDADGNSVTTAAVTVTAALDAPGAALSGTTTVATVNGRALFSDLSIADSGSYRLRFSSAGLADVTSSTVSVASPASATCAAAGANGLKLNLELGRTVRRTTTAADLPTCLEFDTAAARGQQYLVMFENLPLTGGYDAGMFPGASSPSSFQFSIQSQPAFFGTTTSSTVLARRSFANALLAGSPAHEWDFGDGPIREGEVQPPAGGLPAPRLLRDGSTIELSSVQAQPAVGDTVQVYLQGIDRLGISSGNQKAVVRFVSDHLIIAEDARLATLTRSSGGTNTPLTDADLQAIAAEYAANASVQGNLLFESRHNSATENWGSPPRVLAVHTLMYSDNVWGYTYSSGTYFAFDYWVSSNGTTRGLAQHPQRVADNLFMHEIAHMRHFGLLERVGRTQVRGNKWLVEGFARFSERLPIAMRLLGTAAPSRLGNVVLPRNPAFGNTYYYEDVPPYIYTSANMLDGYGSSSYVFDYFADQVALGGGDPIAALREFLVYAGDEPSLNAVINRYLPGVTFGELFTRARIALYADDNGVVLPGTTQYLQFQLRASRPPGSNAAPLDPRNAWVKLSPGKLEAVEPVTLAAGTARGVLIDGTVAELGSARILIEAARVPNGVLSITRIR